MTTKAQLIEVAADVADKLTNLADICPNNKKTNEAFRAAGLEHSRCVEDLAAGFVRLTRILQGRK